MKANTLSTALAVIATIVIAVINVTSPSKPSEATKTTQNAGMNSPDGQTTSVGKLHGKKIKRVYQAKVIRVVDGDTVELLLPDNSHPNCRLDSIDAPEKRQEFGARSLNALKDLVVGKVATVYETALDRYQRPVVFLVVENVDVAAFMVVNGFAWEYKQYSKSDSLAQFEAKARRNGRGLWRVANAQPPWEWRKRR